MNQVDFIIRRSLKIPGSLCCLGVLVSLVFGLSLRTAAQEPLPSTPTGVPVVFEGSQLFKVYSRLGTYLPNERASIIASRLKQFAEDPAFATSSLQVVDRTDRSEIATGEITLATVTDEDALAIGRPRRQIAQENRRHLVMAIERYRNDRTARSLALGALYSFLALTTLLVGLRAAGFVASKVHRRLISRLGSTGEQQDSQTNTIVPISLFGKRVETRGILLESALGAVDRLTSLLHLIFVLVSMYVFIAFSFGLFPWTRGYAETLLGYVRGHVSVIASALLAKLPDFLFIAVIVAITWFVVRFTRTLFKAIELKHVTIPGIDAEIAPPTYRLVRTLILALAAVAIFPYVPGFHSPAFQGVSVFIGALITLGSTSAISNLVAGIMLVYMRPFRIGDRVKIGETVGDVVDKTDLVTRIRTPKNEDVTIPNSLILGAPVTNYSAMAKTTGLILHTSVTIGYDASWRQVHELLLSAARRTDGILSEPAPFVHQTALDDFFVSYEINAYTAEPSRMIGIYSELHSNIQDAFNEAGVEIMSPHYTSVRDGNTVAIPSSYLPSDYQKPGFHVETTGVQDTPV